MGDFLEGVAMILVALGFVMLVIYGVYKLEYWGSTIKLNRELKKLEEDDNDG